MKKKIKQSVSLLITVMLIAGIFTALPMTASAATNLSDNYELLLSPSSIEYNGEEQAVTTTVRTKWGEGLPLVLGVDYEISVTATRQPVLVPIPLRSPESAITAES